MKKLLYVLLCLLLLTGCAAPAAEATYKEISMQEAIALMEKEEGYILLDVRTPEEFHEGHIPGAINIDNNTIADAPPEQLPDRDQLILIYCRSGNRSKQAAAKLAAMGYTNVAEFGGIIDWPGDIAAG
ncbi:MAG: rhodanese-like domain-containing protein [Christensenellaceae bacterium]|nr:rhodanese-like domain-containing protein [Christensenellaceae bacterium]